VAYWTTIFKYGGAKLLCINANGQKTNSMKKIAKDYGIYRKRVALSICEVIK
jgi:hypothetical protein